MIRRSRQVIKYFAISNNVFDFKSLLYNQILKYYLQNLNRNSGNMVCESKHAEWRKDEILTKLKKLY